MFNTTYKVVNKRKRSGMKRAKTRPAKMTDNPVIAKILKLKYRINDAYKKFGRSGLNTKKDKSWVMRRINEVRSNQPLSKDALEYANKLWSDYEKYTV